VWWAFRNDNAPIRDDEAATTAVIECLESAGPKEKDKCYRDMSSDLLDCTKEHGSVSQRAGRRVAGLVLDERCVTEITSDGETNNEFCFSDDEKMRMLKEAESRFDLK
jgi:hypothetical protein